MPEKSNKNFIITVAVVVVLNISLILLSGFLFRAIGLKKTAFFETKDRIVSCEKRIKANAEIEKFFNETESDRSKLKATFLGEEDMINFIKELEYLAEETKVAMVMKGVNMPSGVGQKPVFTFSLVGSFQDIYRYFRLLENDRYRSGFRGVYFGKAGEGTSWEANLELDFLSFKDKNEI